MARQLEIPRLIPVPVSALDGDNVVHRSTRMPFYEGPSILELLETLPLAIEESTGAYVPVADSAGNPSGRIRISADSQGRSSSRRGSAPATRLLRSALGLPELEFAQPLLLTWDGELARAHAPQSVVITLEDEVDLSRGEMIAAVEAPPRKTTADSKPRSSGCIRKLAHVSAQPTCSSTLSQTVRATVVELRSRIDVEHLAENSAAQLTLNDIGQVVLETSRPSPWLDLYSREPLPPAALILIDPSR